MRKRDKMVLRKHIDPDRVRIGLRVAKEIKEANKKFDIKTWVRNENDNPKWPPRPPVFDCGTTACLMGWMGADQECNDLGYQCDAYGPRLNGTLQYSHFRFWMKTKPDRIPNSVVVAITNIITSGYDKKREETTIDTVISKLENLLEIVTT